MIAALRLTGMSSTAATYTRTLAHLVVTVCFASGRLLDGALAMGVRQERERQAAVERVDRATQWTHYSCAHAAAAVSSGRRRRSGLGASGACGAHLRHQL